MKLLRDRWRRTAFQQFLDELDPVDRATFWVAVALGLALGFSATMLARAPGAAAELSPTVTALPLTIEIAEALT